MGSWAKQSADESECVVSSMYERASSKPYVLRRRRRILISLIYTIWDVLTLETNPDPPTRWTTVTEMMGISQAPETSPRTPPRSQGAPAWTPGEPQGPQTVLSCTLREWSPFLHPQGRPRGARCQGGPLLGASTTSMTSRMSDINIYI